MGQSTSQQRDKSLERRKADDLQAKLPAQELNGVDRATEMDNGTVTELEGSWHGYEVPEATSPVNPRAT